MVMPNALLRGPIIGLVALSMTAHAEPKLATTPTPVLSDHLTLSLPQGMRIEARGHSIMAADASAEHETRGVLDVGKGRFVMMAYELFAAPGADFKASVNASLKAEGVTATLESLAIPAPLVGFGAAVTTTGKDDANLIYMAYVASGDHSVQMLAFYVNPDGFTADAAGFTALAKKMSASIRAGKRALDVKAKDHKFRGAGSDKLVVSAPDGWVSSTQDGPDFSVYHLRKMVDLGATDSPSCGIYIGGHPSFQHTQAGVPDAKVKQVAGKLLGGATSWHEWTNGARTMTEAIVEHPLQKSLRLHVFCSAAGDLTPLRKIAETLRVEK
jgi:hypothetical protein